MKHCHSCHAPLDNPELFCPECGAYATNEFGGVLASFGRRAAAAAIDGAAFVTWYLSAVWVKSTGQADIFDPPYSAEENVLIVGSLAYVVAVFWLTFTGRSIGKALLGLRVVDSEGSVASVPWLILREGLAKPVSMVPLGIGYLAALFDDRHRTLHDRIARTYVVHFDVEERRRLRRRTVSSARRKRRANAM